MTDREEESLNFNFLPDLLRRSTTRGPGGGGHDVEAGMARPSRVGGRRNSVFRGSGKRRLQMMRLANMEAMDARRQLQPLRAAAGAGDILNHRLEGRPVTINARFQMMQQIGGAINIQELNNGGSSYSEVNGQNSMSYVNNASYISEVTNGQESAAALLLPHWSTEDKSERILVKPSLATQMLQTNIPITVLYLVVLVIFLSQDNTEQLQKVLVWGLVAFIALQTVATIAQAVPDNAVHTGELDQRTTAIIFVSMVLYPCLGMWVVEHDQAWKLPGINRLWNVKDDTTGQYTWGYVFPFLLWGLSAIMFMRGAYSAFGRDSSGVVSDEDGKPKTQLYRTIPGYWEVKMAKFCRIATITPWHLLGENIKPASHSGRFLFQLMGHVPLIFLYIGFRFCAYSWGQLRDIVEIGPLENFVASRTTGVSDFVITARLIVWTAFFIHTIVLRAILPSHVFLSWAIEDDQSLYYRSIGWQQYVTPTKRTRLLWGFRGFTLAFVPYAIHKVNQGDWNDFSDGGRRFWFVLYGMQLVSYFMEGVMALFWALNEAARFCNLHHPLAWGVAFFFWCSYNVFLQPVGTFLNIIFYFVNGEGVRGVVLLELWGPLIKRGAWKPWVQNIIDKFNRSTQTNQTLDNASIDKRLEEWIDTWKRKRNEVGKPADNYNVVRRPSSDAPKVEGDDPIQVFSGTVFPTKEEWLSMRDHPEQHISLDLWNHSHPEEKFVDWYPTYSEEVIKLLKEPYDFDVKREIWMFGYGSLLSPDCPPAGLTARQRKLLLPYWLKKSSGYKNSFSFRHGSCSINALGLIPVQEGDQRQHVAGCVYPIDYEVACDLFCLREDGYEFLLVAVEHFQAMHPDYQIPEGVGYIWMCGAPTQTCGDRFSTECDDWYCKRHVATVDSPILQTYVDSIMAGALRYATSGNGQEDGMKFCAAIISTIQDWDFPWYNDRILSGRPWVWRKEFQLIDGLLNTCPNTSVAFAKRMNPMIDSPGATRQRMIILDELRYEEWTKHFFAPYQEGSREAPLVGGGHRRLSQCAQARFDKLGGRSNRGCHSSAKKSLRDQAPDLVTIMDRSSQDEIEESESNSSSEEPEDHAAEVETFENEAGATPTPQNTETATSPAILSAMTFANFGDRIAGALHLADELSV